jgi:sugar phosphate isomerase/epimerase
MSKLAQLSVITDEISQDFEEALQIAQQFDIQQVELRSIWRKNIARFSDVELLKLKELLKKYQMKISVISGPFAKCFLPSSRLSSKNESFDRNSAYNLSFFDRLVEISDYFDTNVIRIFNFFNPAMKIKEEKWTEMIDLITPFVEKAEKLGKILVVENEHVCFANNVANTLKFLKHFNSKALKLNLDPGNFFSMKERTTPDAYQTLYDNGFVIHIHIKDPQFRIPLIGGFFGVVGQGKIDYEPLLTQAIDNGYKGAFALETHALKNKKQKSIESLQYLHEILENL